MSDGPHRSLPMTAAWKRLAKFGDQQTYDSDQIREAAIHALSRDLTNEVKWSLLDALKSIFIGRNNSLGLPELALQELTTVKSLAAGSVFGLNVAACSNQLIKEGKLGLEAFHEAVGMAAKMRGFANVRSVEEHFLRESNSRRADSVGMRLYGAISSLSENALGSMLVAPKSEGSRKPRKKIRLEDGVAIV
jgi:hypothetical protein